MYGKDQRPTATAAAIQSSARPTLLAFGNSQPQSSPATALLLAGKSLIGSMSLACA